jgi:hypothetical protein
MALIDELLADGADVKRIITDACAALPPAKAGPIVEHVVGVVRDLRAGALDEDEARSFLGRVPALIAGTHG